MGYEINFFYHERGEDGKYNMDSQQSFTKTIGRKSTEVALEQVAAVILGQLARRDIWIVDVQVFEFARREITFKETKNGVLIKNRKFHYDQICGHLTSDEEDDCSEQRQPQQQQQMSIPIQFSNAKPVPITARPPVRDPNIPVRQELFRPNREDYPVLQRQGIKLTMGKPYPIFNEVIKNEFEPIYYVVQDDQGNRIEVSSLFFEPMRRGLVGIGVNDPGVPVSEGRLSYVDTSPIATTGNPKLDSYLAAQDAALMRRI